MRMRVPLAVATALASICLGTGARATAPPPKERPRTETSAVDQRAKDMLARMGDTLKVLRTFSLHEDVTREQVINNDLKVQKATTADVVFRRPDGLRADVVGDDDKNFSVYFDGTALTVYMPLRKYFAQLSAPGTVRAALDVAESRYGVDFPGADFLRMSSGESFVKELTAAGYVGKSRVGNVECEHYAYRTPEVDYQVWFDAEGKPLPRKIVITSKKEPTQPEYVSIMTWNLSPNPVASTFVFIPPEGVTRIVFGSPPAGATGGKGAEQK